MVQDFFHQQYHFLGVPSFSLWDNWILIRLWAIGMRFAPMLLPCLHNVPGTPRQGVFNLWKLIPSVVFKHVWISTFLVCGWFRWVFTGWFMFSISTVLEISGMVLYKLLLGLKCSSLNGKATICVWKDFLDRLNHVNFTEVSNEQKPGCLGYSGILLPSYMMIYKPL